jgi:formate/nitrite transporter
MEEIIMNTPAEAAKLYVQAGKGKANQTLGRMFVQAIMAGAFIAFGAVAATTAAVSVQQASVGKLIGACVFPGGLAMVLCTGSELFTGNCLLVVPLLEREITPEQLIRNWVVVYLGNMVGSFIVAAISVYGHQAGLFANGVAVSMISTAVGKVGLSFEDAFLKGVACNFLVCIAVWIGGFVAKTVCGKIVGLFFPIMIFVVSGFEHSVANMYYISVGLFAEKNPVYAAAAAEVGCDVSGLTWDAFISKNLVPVTLGNIVGGAVVGIVFWYVYLSGSRKQNPKK